MIPLLKNKIIHSIIFFVVAFGITTLIPSGVITMDRYLAIILFLFAISFFLLIFFKRELAVVVQKTHKHEFFILFIFSLFFHGISSYLVLNFLSQPVWPFDSRGTSFLLMNNFFIFAKPFEVFVQQLLIILLVTRLHQSGMSLKKIIMLFVFGFGVIHIFQIFKTDLIIGLGFTFFAILASLIFPYMLLRVRNGYIYNFMIHLAAYDIAAILTWSLY